MRKVKIISIALIVSALLWAVNSTSDSPPDRDAGFSRNHTRAVVVTNFVHPTHLASAAKTE
jgi:hypothetical protein